MTHTQTAAWTNGSNSLTSTLTASANTEIDMDIPVTGSITDLPIALNIFTGAILSFYCTSDKAVTLNFNVTGSGTPSVPLAAGGSFSWISGSQAASPLTEDVTELFITNSGTGSAVVKLRFLVDTTWFS